MTLLLLTIGPPEVTRLLASYAAVRSPELYVSAESDAFATFLAQQSLPVPFLGEVLGFEHALIRAELYGENSTVNFTHDPAALFSSLEQGRMPGNLPPVDGIVPVSVQPRN